MFIVIIGILAAAAIPRLAATRDDAKAVVCMDDVSSFVAQVTSYYTSQGSLKKISDMTNFLTNANSTNKFNGFSSDVDIGAGIEKVRYMCNGASLLEYSISGDSTDLYLVEVDVTNNDQNHRVAKIAVKGLLHGADSRTYKLGGKSVNF